MLAKRGTCCVSCCFFVTLNLVDIHLSEVVLELVSPSPRGTDGRDEGGHPLGLGEGEEFAHAARGEANEVQ